MHWLKHISVMSMTMSNQTSGPQLGGNNAKMIILGNPGKWLSVLNLYLKFLEVKHYFLFHHFSVYK